MWGISDQVTDANRSEIIQLARETTQTISFLNPFSVALPSGSSIGEMLEPATCTYVRIATPLSTQASGFMLTDYMFFVTILARQVFLKDKCVTDDWVSHLDVTSCRCAQLPT